MATAMKKEDAPAIQLRAVGFCGVDSSVDPELLVLISRRYPFAEWGVLFRADKEGLPRYPRMPWVRRLSEASNEAVASGVLKEPLRLAAHFCGAAVNGVLRGDASLAKELHGLGFRRVQINATEVNGTDMSLLADAEIGNTAGSLAKVFGAVPGIEFIMQYNTQTVALCRAVLSKGDEAAGSRFPNVSFLFDASMGLGTKISFGGGDQGPPRPSVVEGYRCGYAGGIGAGNVAETLAGISSVVEGDDKFKGKPASIWIDMESSLRCTAKAGSRGSSVLEAAGAAGAAGAAAGAGEGREDLFSCDAAFCCARVCEPLVVAQ